MARYTGRRLLASAVAVAILVVVVFLMTKAIPGDEAHVAAGASATPAQVAAMRHTLGLDRSVPAQLLTYVDRVIHGNLGTSIMTHAPVSRAIGQALPVTFELVILAMILMLALVVPAAIIATLRPERTADNSIRVAVLLFAALPTYWIALELQQLLTDKLRLFPSTGSISNGYDVPRHTGSVLLDSLLAGNGAAFSNAFQHYLLPAFILMIPFTATLFRALRAEMLSVLGREHIMVARACGLPTGRLIFRHVLPNAAGPALTVLGVQVGDMIGASVLVEAVFGLNGMGSFLTTAVYNKDTFAVLAGVLVIGVIVVCANLVVDLLQMVRDPRLRAVTVGV
jgi:ABC-type dipeptide/oligopeptide/nickel transport system permease component